MATNDIESGMSKTSDFAILPPRYQEIHQRFEQTLRTRGARKAMANGETQADKWSKRLDLPRLSSG